MPSFPMRSFDPPALAVGEGRFPDRHVALPGFLHTDPDRRGLVRVRDDRVDRRVVESNEVERDRVRDRLPLRVRG